MHIDTTNIETFFTNANKTIRSFEKNGSPVMYVTNEWKNPILNLLTGNVCKKGGAGVGPDPRLLRINEKIYRKSKMNALSNRALATDLQAGRVSDIYLMGLFAEHCVKATLIAALKKKFRVTVITDALGAKSDKTLSKCLEFYNRNGATLICPGGSFSFTCLPVWTTGLFLWSHPRNGSRVTR